MKQYTDKQRIITSITILIIAIGGGYLYGGEKLVLPLLKFVGVVLLLGLSQKLLIKFNIISDNSEKIKEEQRKQQEFNAKLKKNKVLLTWFISMFIGFFASFVIPFLLLSSPAEGNPNVWVLHIDVIKNNYWVFAAIFYPYSITVFIIGKSILRNEKANKYGFYGASIFCWTLFTVYLALTQDQPNLIFVMFVLCLCVTWMQLSLSKIFFHASQTTL